MADTPKINVNITRIFEGYRHERLRLLWDVAAEYMKRKFTLHWFANTRNLRHEEALAHMWERELDRPERYCIITEHDFLPRFWAFTPTPALTREYPVLCARYVTRDPNTRRIVQHSVPGPWYILVDKDRVKKLHFEDWGEFKDPANGLQHYLEMEYPGKSVKYLPTTDCLPRHYGVNCVTGEHLFWSRHLHDDENMRVSGVCLGDMQRKHDEAVTDWACTQPEGYRERLRVRLKSNLIAAGTYEERLLGV